MSFDTSPNVFSARDIFKRCVKCESAAPSCPACDEGYTCTMISQSCDQCATTKCIQTSSSSLSSSGNSGSSGGNNAGAIAGGVIGGLAFVTIVVGLIWWFYMRKKKSSNEYSLGGSSVQEKRTANAQGSRKSTNSIASTVLTRASNVIQIAYIPGVTNRSPPDTPSLVPPVPPLPGAAPDQHFFMPGDLRDSSFTEMSNDRRSGAPSVSPSLRSSVATTIYRNNAIVSPMPAQQVMRTRAAVVSIHGNQPTETATITPPDAPAVPAITPAQLAKAGVTNANNGGDNNSSIVARPMMAKPVMVKTVGGKKKDNNNATPAVQAIEERSEPSSSAPVSRSASTKQQADPAASGFDDSSDEEDEPSGKGAKATKSTEQPPTVAEASEEQGPFTDRASTHLETHDGPGSNRSSRTPPARVESPFSDANEVR
ncbi:uncharacterized protein EURHEDRAFT_406598 [Aspergillus ruber CBS 135680]|uniref:Membrane anchor Opy2 N-terminal domain-containing protein n=1 Tax=Aspergillus ruber (strain CBS 135680) TaxID=1388766 RepID=A0A017S3L4_ASPRC|nr:uncharacterized protein EURHEDRAFT_406598 [Aspergillus ruber CBS 135680]EYE90780.1 hypothetical protein EURHEDRAFT_406598 [Aspergillus ruber CBS 135680]